MLNPKAKDKTWEELEEGKHDQNIPYEKFLFSIKRKQTLTKRRYDLCVIQGSLFFRSYLLKYTLSLDLMAYPFNLSTWELQADEQKELFVPGHPWLQSKTLSQKEKTNAYRK